MYPIADFIRDLGEIPSVSDPLSLRAKSRDRYSVSPMLRESLKGKLADVIVSPRSKDDVRRAITAAVRHRIPLTVRGGGTANYGQAVPLHGGVVLDMTGMSGTLWVHTGSMRSLAGTSLMDMDEAARQTGRELRIYSTTKKSATIGGFVAGGTGGIGSCTWGVLRDPGNICALEVMSMEAEPRTLELRGRDIALVHHAYGTNCIITEVEMPVDTAWDWRESLVAFPDYLQAVRFGINLAQQTAILKKLVTVHEWPTPGLMGRLKRLVPEGHTIAFCMIADQHRQDFTELLEDAGGKLVSDCPEGQGSYGAPLYEFVFGHALFELQKTHSRYTGIEGFFQSDDLLDLVQRVHGKVNGLGPMRMDLIRSGGRLSAIGTPYVLFESEQQMAGIVRLMQSEGVSVANSHTPGVRGVGKKVISDRDEPFKRSMDPFNLLNPGKFDFGDSEANEYRTDLPTDGWAMPRPH